MMRHFFFITYVLLLTSSLNAQTINCHNKDSVIALYKKLYLSSHLKSMKWIAGESPCHDGKLSNSVYVLAENRINFFRITAGLSSIKISRELSIESQKAAVLTKNNGYLSHSPPKSSSCYSKQAYDGCHKSCLGFTYYSHPKENISDESFITAFMKDYGESNYFVGHRKWLLYTKLSEVGYGATDTTEAILTADGIDYNMKDSIEYVSYPWSGYVPSNLVFPKWSFSLPQSLSADFSNAKVEMKTENGELLNTRKFQLYPDYLDHTIVWEATSLFSKEEIYYGENSIEDSKHIDHKIFVKISNVLIDGKQKSFEYFVIPIQIK
jgi:hypothetical protein